MSDDIDRAQELEELQRKMALDAMKVTGNERLTGWCQNDCGMPTKGAYCSKECRRDHELILRNERMRP